MPAGKLESKEEIKKRLEGVIWLSVKRAKLTFCEFFESKITFLPNEYREILLISSDFPSILVHRILCCLIKFTIYQ